MMKLILFFSAVIAATFAADAPAAAQPVAPNFYRQDPYYRNNDYYRSNNYYNNDYYRNNYNRNDPYYRNNYDRNNYYRNNVYDYNYNNNYRYTPGAEASARVLKFESDVRPDGSYEYSYNTENGISAGESGVHRYVDQENGVQSVQGYYEYVSPEGVPVSVRYVADEYGFRPESNVLPKNVVVNKN